MDVQIACICPLRADATLRHPSGDVVTLRDRLDFRAALTARNVVVLIKTEDPDATAAEVLAALTEMYLILGVESWTLTDFKNKPVAPSKAAIRELLAQHPDAAMTLADAADDLYAEAVILPLLARASSSSPPTPISASTSATIPSTPVRLKHSKRSSTSTTRTDAIATTSPLPDGVSSSSLSSRSAG